MRSQSILSGLSGLHGTVVAAAGGGMFLHARKAQPQNDSDVELFHDYDSVSGPSQPNLLIFIAPGFASDKHDRKSRPQQLGCSIEAI